MNAKTTTTATTTWDDIIRNVNAEAARRRTNDLAFNDRMAQYAAKIRSTK
jgi:hypothetical protein